MSEIMPKSEHSLQIIAQIHNDFPENLVFLIRADG